MRGDPREHLLSRGFELSAARPDQLEAARHLAGLGLCTIAVREFVHCAHFEDDDFQEVLDRTCDGRVYVDRRGDENDGAFRCPGCGREVHPTRKRRFVAETIVPRVEGMLAFLSEQIRRCGFDVSVDTNSGVTRALDGGREARLVLADVDANDAAAPPERSLWIIGDTCFAHRVPRGAPSLRLVDLALSVTTALRDALSEFMTAPAVIASAEPPFCRLLSNGEERTITRAEYDEIRASLATFGMALDTMHPANRRSFPCSHLDDRGNQRARKLSVEEARIIVALVRRGRPMSVTSLVGPAGTRRSRTIKEAIDKIDLVIAEGIWRCFVRLAGKSESDQQYHFKPPKDFRYAILIPLEDRDP